LPDPLAGVLAASSVYQDQRENRGIVMQPFINHEVALAREADQRRRAERDRRLNAAISRRPRRRCQLKRPGHRGGRGRALRAGLAGPRVGRGVLPVERAVQGSVRRVHEKAGHPADEIYELPVEVV
jgi:hypothetical protein